MNEFLLTTNRDYNTLLAENLPETHMPTFRHQMNPNSVHTKSQPAETKTPYSNYATPQLTIQTTLNQQIYKSAVYKHQYKYKTAAPSNVEYDGKYPSCYKQLHSLHFL